MVLDQVGHLPQRAICQDWQHAHGARAIVGDQQPPPVRVDLEMARRVPAAHLVVDRLYAPRLVPAAKRPDRAGHAFLLLVRLAHRVQPVPVRVDNYKRWVGNAGKRGVQGQLASGVVEGTGMNAWLIGGGITANIQRML